MIREPIVDGIRDGIYPRSKVDLVSIRNGSGIRSFLDITAICNPNRMASGTQSKNRASHLTPNTLQPSTINPAPLRLHRHLSNARPVISNAAQI